MQTLAEIEHFFLQELHNAKDVVIQPFMYQKQNGLVIYLDSLVDEQWLERALFDSMMKTKDQHVPLKENITALTVEEFKSAEECLPFCWIGYGIVVVESNPLQFLALKTPLTRTRAIEEPFNERALRGAHEGFIEDLTINISMVRKTARVEGLVIHTEIVGQSLKKEVAMMYIDGKADTAIVKNIENKLKAIDEDLISSPGTLNELLQGSKKSVFPQILYTERPDTVVGNLMEGRIVLFIEGNPTALILPVSFFSFMQSVDDYNVHFVLGSFLRVIRMIALFISILLPSLYISLVAFHFEVIPQPLIISVKSSLQNIPYPPLIEALIMEFTIELIREAGLRLPAPIGQTIGIVGGLVIGEAVVNAGLVSNIMIIVVAVTAISSFVIPSPEMGSIIRLSRFPLMLAAATFGLIGVVLSFFVILMHLIKLESFGTPYLSPIAPFNRKGIKDAIVRFPTWLIQRHTFTSSTKPLNGDQKR
ncbi:spore germination protein [Alkalihalobacillus sp. LMS6]|uniref:spore germination protein n=1 Tax=Bacillaceae TaxID=186817 RepID=UPI000C07BB83|nr:MULTISPECIES: spore germination protein [Bacillaceae]UTR06931.1 spore germination protein [Alkalihalobacillus sp. LMS6]